MADTSTRPESVEWLRIRRAGPADQSFISEMQYAALFVPQGEAPFPRSILDQPNIARSHGGFGTLAGDGGVIAEDLDQRPLGAAWARLVEGYGFVDALTPELGIAVVANASGRGVGSALLRRLTVMVPRVSLSVDIRNPAMRWYERFALRTVRIEGEHTAVMLRTGVGP